MSNFTLPELPSTGKGNIMVAQIDGEKIFMQDLNEMISKNSSFSVKLMRWLTCWLNECLQPHNTEPCKRILPAIELTYTSLIRNAKMLAGFTIDFPSILLVQHQLLWGIIELRPECKEALVWFHSNDNLYGEVEKHIQLMLETVYNIQNRDSIQWSVKMMNGTSSETSYSSASRTKPDVQSTLAILASSSIAMGAAFPSDNLSLKSQVRDYKVLFAKMIASLPLDQRLCSGHRPEVCLRFKYAQYINFEGCI
jgi:hypothetical protein